jgi:HAD superfamily hydrolase (TIGR01458 family)
MIKGLLLDLSGTVYEDDKLIPGALEAVERLHASNFPVRYLTNSSRTPRNKILSRLQGMGFTVHAEEIFTAPAAIKDYLREHRLNPWLLIHPDIEEEFTEFHGQSPDTVVICDAAHAFTYENLNRAFRMLIDGARLLAVGDNRYFKQADGLSLDAGPFVRALEYAVDCEAIILGKPSSTFFHAAVAKLGCKPSEVLMVGDDVDSDINGALKAGLKATLVRTGKYRDGDEGKIAAPGARVCADLLEAVRAFQV